MGNINAISHIAVGVTDMERSLGFYRDVLGMHISLDTEEELPGFAGSDAQKRRAVYLRWREGPHETFIVLDQQLSREPFGEPPTLFQVGTHHWGVWVDDVDGVVERAEARLGESEYSLFTNNCEHFANDCADGRARSPQLKWMLPTLAAGVLVVAATGNRVLRSGAARGAA